MIKRHQELGIDEVNTIKKMVGVVGSSYREVEAQGKGQPGWVRAKEIIIVYSRRKKWKIRSTSKSPIQNPRSMVHSVDATAPNQGVDSSN